MLSAADLSAQAAPPPEVSDRDIENQIREPGRRKAQVSEIEKAAEEQRKRQVAQGGAEVSYEQIMANPDDVDLNYRYALTQVGHGNLRSATATLERILMVKTDLPKVKLFYGIVLFRLDNLDDAERVLQDLKNDQMPDSLRAELNDYIAQIHSKRRKARFSVLLGAGFDYDDNRNAGPATGRRLFLDAPIVLFTGTRQSDIARTMMANIDGSYDLGFQAGHSVFAGVGYYRSQQVDLRTLNLQTYSADAGVTLKSRSLGNFTPSVGFTHLLLGQTTYLRSREVRGKYEKVLAPGLSGSVEAGYQRNEYNRTWVVPTGDQRTGDKFDVGFGLSLGLSNTRKLSLSFTHSETGAREPFNISTRDSLTLGHSWLLGKGMFFLASATGNFDRYEKPERVISVRTREDDSYRVRGTYGLPMSLFYKPLKDFTWTASYEYFQSFSNLLSYAYTNNKISSMMTYKWQL